MAGKNNGLDAIMAMMALKTLMNDTKDLAIHPFTIEVTVTPGSIGCSASGNRKFLEDLDGGIEWLDETNDRVMDIMAEQTTKLAELMKRSLVLRLLQLIPTPKMVSQNLWKLSSGGQNDSE